MAAREDKQGLGLFEFSGEPGARGYSYGEEVRSEINRCITFFHRWIERNGLTLNEAREITEKYAPFVEEYSPEIAAEIQAVAAGAKIDYRDILMLSLNEERKIYPRAGKCTAFAASGRANRSGRTIIGQSWDNFVEWQDNFRDLLILRRSPAGPDVLSYAYPGMLAAAGVNSAGIGLCWNSVPRLDLKVGVPTYVIVAEVLRQRTLGDALAAVMRAKRAGCFNFLIAEESEIYNIEATPDDIEISYSSRYLSHANHYLTPRFVQATPDPEGKEECKRRAASIIRHNRMNCLLEEQAGNISLASCQGFLRDHVNHPHSICRHPDPAAAYAEKLLTRAAWIIEPGQQRMWFAGGPPCRNEFTSYNL